MKDYRLLVMQAVVALSVGACSGGTNPDLPGDATSPGPEETASPTDETGNRQGAATGAAGMGADGARTERTTAEPTVPVGNPSESDAQTSGPANDSMADGPTSTSAEIPPTMAAPMVDDPGASEPENAQAEDSDGEPQADQGASDALGPKNGDPNAPVVELPDVPCRQASALSGTRGGSSLNATIDGRELAIDYPCGKHEGAHMTVIVNLHGTLIGGAPFLYQRSYFSAYRYADSHNLIVIHPQSASRTSFGAQWGNDDDGTDLPHLIAVMNWVYESFSKFNLRSTWIAGHSWGAVYAEGAYGRPGFVCNEMFQDQFKGVVGLSYIAPPPCAERVSMIGTQGEEEDFDQLDQGPIAQMHGCDPEMKGPERVGNNERYYWDGCDPGWVHEDWNMLGKGHIDAMDAEVVQHIIEKIKSTEI